MKLGIIGGSGLYAMPGLEGRWREVETPWGQPSDAILDGTLAGMAVAFLPRHGRGHRLAPGEIPARANIAALKLLGCTAVLAVGAVGSLREALAPGHFLLPDQIFDDTRGRPSSFFGAGIVAHVSLAEPVAHDLLDRVEAAAARAGVPASRGGSYGCIDGPRFATRAESLARRAAGWDVVGMTAMPEAHLAREAELAYALVAMVTDFDAWADTHVTTAAVVEVMAANRGRAQALVRETAAELAANPLPLPSAQGWERALDGAIITARAHWPEATRQRLLAIAGRVLE